MRCRLSDPTFTICVLAITFALGSIGCDDNAGGADETSGSAAPSASGESGNEGSEESPEIPAVPQPEAVAPAQRAETDEESAAPKGALPNPRPIKLDTDLEEEIAAPSTVQSDSLRFETDWFALDVGAGQTARITVEPVRGSSLRPMVTVLLPDEQKRGEWAEIDALRATEEGERLSLEVTFRTTGTKLVTVDDARNVPKVGDDELPSKFHGGEKYGYELRVTGPGDSE